MSKNDHLKILFVEDHVETLHNYQRFFQRYYKNFEVAVDGLEAYKKYQSFKPDIIFLDINIPKLDGIELLKRIRRQDLVTKVIMLTAHSEDKFVNKVMELGVSSYLIKPVGRGEIKETLNKVEEEIRNKEIDYEKTRENTKGREAV